MSSATSATNSNKLNSGNFPALGTSNAGKKNTAKGKRSAGPAENMQNQDSIPQDTYNEMFRAMNQEIDRLKEEANKREADLALAQKTISQLSTPSTSDGTSHTQLVAQLTDAQAQILNKESELAAVKNDLAGAQSLCAEKEEALSKLAEELTKAKVANNLEEDLSVLPTENPPGVTGITRITMNPPYRRAMALVNKVEAFVATTSELVNSVTPLFKNSPFYFQANDAVGKEMVEKLGFACETVNNTETRVVVENKLYDRFTKACVVYKTEILGMVEAVNKELNILYEYKCKRAEITTPLTPEMKRVFIMKMLCPADEINKKDELHDLAHKNCMDAAERLYKGMLAIDTNMDSIRHMINHVWDRSAACVFKDEANKKAKVAERVPRINLDSRVSF